MNWLNFIYGVLGHKIWICNDHFSIFITETMIKFQKKRGSIFWNYQMISFSSNEFIYWKAMAHATPTRLITELRKQAEWYHFISSVTAKLDIIQCYTRRAMQITLLCCSIRTSKGTSSAFVKPPKGCSNRIGFLHPISKSRLRVSFINKACPLCTGFLNWKAKTASAWRLSNSFRSCWGESL